LQAVLGIWAFAHDVQEEYENYLQLGRVASDTHQTPEQTKIPLEAHIMSKCPDAQDCLQKLVLPAMALWFKYQSNV
jgi:hypothetical protein